MAGLTLASQQSRHALSVILAAWSLVMSPISLADIPTPQQECEVRNLAVCVFTASGVKSSQPSPCPPGSLTLKPGGIENCSAPAPSANRFAAPTRATATTTFHGTDLAWIGGIERWLIPVMVYTLLGCVAMLVWVLVRRRPAAGSAVRGDTMAVLISAACSVASGWKAASASFGVVFNSYDNHDSAAPLLLGVPVWLGTFVIVTAIVFAILMLGWKVVRTRAK